MTKELDLAIKMADDLILDALNQLMVALGFYAAVMSKSHEHFAFNEDNFSWSHQETTEGYTDGYVELSTQVIDADVIVSIIQHTPDSLMDEVL
jgi:hypothetical protein